MAVLIGKNIGIITLATIFYLFVVYVLSVIHSTSSEAYQFLLGVGAIVLVVYFAKKFVKQ